MRKSSAASTVSLSSELFIKRFPLECGALHAPAGSRLGPRVTAFVVATFRGMVSLNLRRTTASSAEDQSGARSALQQSTRDDNTTTIILHLAQKKERKYAHARCPCGFIVLSPSLESIEILSGFQPFFTRVSLNQPVPLPLHASLAFFPLSRCPSIYELLFFGSARLNHYLLSKPDRRRIPLRDDQY